MNDALMNKCIKISRLIIFLLVFLVLNSWFIFENDPQWIATSIISLICFLISFPSSKLSIFIIKKGDKIKNNIYRFLYYAFLLPIIFFLIVLVTALLCSIIVEYVIPDGIMTLGVAVLIAFSAIVLFTCILVPYFQTLIVLILRKLNQKII